jgi:hypothetical protein
MTGEEFLARVVRALEDLGVAEVAVDRVAAEADGGQKGQWSADLRLASRPATPVSIRATENPDEARFAADLRAELRRALRMCPLCQRIGHVEKLRNAQGEQEACAVRCPSCGEFEIDQALIRELRGAWERGDRDVLDRLPAVSTATREGAQPRLTRENWRPR